MSTANNVTKKVKNDPISKEEDIRSYTEYTIWFGKKYKRLNPNEALISRYQENVHNIRVQIWSKSIEEAIAAAWKFLKLNKDDYEIVCVTNSTGMYLIRNNRDD